MTNEVIQFKEFKVGIPSDLYHELNGIAVMRNKEFADVVKEAIALWLAIATAGDIEIKLDGENFVVDL